MMCFSLKRWPKTKKSFNDQLLEDYYETLREHFCRKKQQTGSRTSNRLTRPSMQRAQHSKRTRWSLETAPRKLAHRFSCRKESTSCTPPRKPHSTNMKHWWPVQHRGCPALTWTQEPSKVAHGCRGWHNNSWASAWWGSASGSSEREAEELHRQRVQEQAKPWTCRLREKSEGPGQWMWATFPCISIGQK